MLVDPLGRDRRAVLRDEAIRRLRLVRAGNDLGQEKGRSSVRRPNWTFRMTRQGERIRSRCKVGGKGAEKW